VIHLLPPVCHDCGRDHDETSLSPYLDFQLCGECIARREREVRDVEGRRVRPPTREPSGARAASKAKGRKAPTSQKGPKSKSKPKAKPKH
jgi:hypothetical protein